MQLERERERGEILRESPCFLKHLSQKYSIWHSSFSTIYTCRPVLHLKTHLVLLEVGWYFCENSHFISAGHQLKPSAARFSQWSIVMTVFEVMFQAIFKNILLLISVCRYHTWPLTHKLLEYPVHIYLPTDSTQQINEAVHIY